VVLLAPLVAGVGVYRRYRTAPAAPLGGGDTVAPGAASGPRPPIVPLFVVGFLVAMLVRTFVPLPEVALATADLVQTVLFGLALVALGSSIRIASLVRTSGRSLLVGLASWVLVAALAWVAVELTTA
jgi:uncharacterized membrane protein YadS